MDQDGLQRTLEETQQAFRVPGLALAITRGDGPSNHQFLGTDATGRALGPDSIFPVASITKLATALAVLRLADQGILLLDAPLTRYAPDAAVAGSNVTLRDLLAHVGGLPLDVSEAEAPYALGLDWPALARACLATAPRWAPRTRVQYSNVGYGILAVVVERQTRRPFGEALGELVLAPLGVEAYLGAEPPRPPVLLADVRGPHAGTDLAPFNSAFWRSLALPWAGLLTTLDGAHALLNAYRGKPAGFLRPETLDAATSNQVGDLGGGQAPPLVWKHCPWGLGPELRDEKRPHWAPSEASPESFGHAGATGCLAWADPVADVAWTLLGTRTADSGWLVRRGPAIGKAIVHPA